MKETGWNRYWQKEINTVNNLCSIAVRNSVFKRHEGGVFFGTTNLFVRLGHVVCFPSRYLWSLKHLHTGNKDSQGNASCKSLSDVNGGLDKWKVGQVIQRLWTAGIANFVRVCVCVSSLQLTKGVDSSRMEMGVKLAHLQSKPRHKLRT